MGYMQYMRITYAYIIYVICTDKLNKKMVLQVKKTNFDFFFLLFLHIGSQFLDLLYERGFGGCMVVVVYVNSLFDLFLLQIKVDEKKNVLSANNNYTKQANKVNRTPFRLLLVKCLFSFDERTAVMLLLLLLLFLKDKHIIK